MPLISSSVMGWMYASMRSISEAHSLAHERSSASVTKKILKLRRKLTEMDEKENEREEFIHAIRKFMEMRTLTKQVLNELIDNIDVYEAQGTGKNAPVGRLPVAHLRLFFRSYRTMYTPNRDRSFLPPLRRSGSAGQFISSDCAAALLSYRI